MFLSFFADEANDRLSERKREKRVVTLLGQIFILRKREERREKREERREKIRQVRDLSFERENENKQDEVTDEDGLDVDDHEWTEDEDEIQEHWTTYTKGEKQMEILSTVFLCSSEIH